VVLMLLIFLVSDLLANKLGWGWLGGAGYGLGGLLAVTYARREALLVVVTAPPVLFLAALVTAELITATGSTLLATAEGTLLALATCAPWLFAVTVVGLIVAMVRGLPQCVRDFKAELSGLGARNDPPGGSGLTRAGLGQPTLEQPTQGMTRPPS
jgi:ABC-type amino acid transport system permease subunit